VTVAGQTWTIDQAIGCTASTDLAGSTAIGAAGGSATANVTTAAGCGWSVVSNASWIVVPGASTRAGSGSVTIGIQSNSGPGRTGTVTVAGQTWTIDQASACVTTVDASGNGIVAGSGGTASATVTTQAGCPWAVSSTVDWIAVSGASTRTGSGTVSVSVSANVGAARSGAVIVAGQTWIVDQLSGCTVSPDLSGVGIAPALGKAYPVTFTASGVGCSNWPAKSDTSWIELSPEYGGSGASKFTVTAYPNFGTASRTGTFKANGQTFTLTQAGSTEPETARFVHLAYFGAMGRLPTPDEIAVWTGEIARGVSRASVIQTLFNSGEFNTGSRFVAGLYVGLLDRDPEYSGWRFQRQALRDKIVDQTTIVQAFLTSAEFVNRWGNTTPAEFVRQMYKYVLLREASDDEVAFQVQALGAAAVYDRFVMARNFLNSEEFRIGTGPRLLAFLLYASVLARDAAQEERTFQANAIRSGVPISVMISAYVGTPEFLALLK